MAKARQNSKVITVEKFTGCNTNDDPRALDPSESPLIINMDITSTGAVACRNGYEKVGEIAGADGGFVGAMPYYKTYETYPGQEDQQQDIDANYTAEYICPMALSEDAKDRLTFTPTKPNIIRIAVYVTHANGGILYLTLHDASNNTLKIAQNIDPTDGAWNYFEVPYTWESGDLHFHLTSSNGRAMVKMDASVITAGDVITEQDPTGTATQVYALPSGIVEDSDNLRELVFGSPTNGLIRIFQIAVWVVAKGSGNITVTLHDDTNATLSSATILNASLVEGEMNYFSLPYVTYTNETTTVYHFHVNQSGTAATIKTSNSSLFMLENASFIVNEPIQDMDGISYDERYTLTGDYLVLFHSNGSAYYYKDGGTIEEIGIYTDTPGNRTRGETFKNLAIFGDTRRVKKWDGVTLANLGGSPSKGNIFGVYGKRLFLSGITDAPTAVHYSEVDDPEIWGGSGTSGSLNVNLGDGQDVTALIGNSDALTVFKEDTVHAMNFGFDSSYNITKPQLQPIISNAGGCYAPDAATAAYSYSYFLSRSGVQSYGAAVEGINAKLPLPISLSITPTIKNINFEEKNKFASTFYDNKYMCAVNLGIPTDQRYVLVYNENFRRRYGVDNWVFYTGIPVQDFVVFRDSMKNDGLYFTDELDPYLYKFNNTFSDNGNGYLRQWRSKTFTFGERTFWRYIDIEGSKTVNSTIFVDINTDGATYPGIEITDSNFISSGRGSTGYIGDNSVGDTYIGGAFGASGNPLYRFKIRIRIPETVNYGNELWFQLRNNADGEGWNLNSFRIIADIDTEDPTYSFTD